MTMRRIDHVGIIVEDLDAAIDFFVDLGLELQGEDELEGEWLGHIIGLDDVKTAIAYLRMPDGESSLELVQFHRPIDSKGIQESFSNTLGIRHIAFVVDDIDAIVAKLKEKGTEIVGTVHNYEDVYKLCYIRGPEGIILELAEELK